MRLTPRRSQASVRCRTRSDAERHVPGSSVSKALLYACCPVRVSAYARTMSLVELLLTDPEDAPDVPAGAYDEALGYSMLDGQPIVTLAAGLEPTETKVEREAPDREVWGGTETRVGNEPRDAEVWASTATITKVSHEADDRDS